MSRQEDHSGHILLHIITEMKKVTRCCKTLPRSLKPILHTKTVRVKRTWRDGLQKKCWDKIWLRKKCEEGRNTNREEKGKGVSTYIDDRMRGISVKQTVPMSLEGSFTLFSLCINTWYNWAFGMIFLWTSLKAKRLKKTSQVSFNPEGGLHLENFLAF